MSDAERLLPCPFCGETRLTVCETDYGSAKAYAVSCCTVDCHGGIWALGHGLFETVQAAIAAWNARALAKEDS